MVFRGGGIAALLLSLLISSASSQVPCPSAMVGDASFDQACSNVCSSANELVGPDMLTSGVSGNYDVAAIYFGHQN